tara:strand:+ start:635 stop:856 length:222 start_codon:yes stop_codon:yes gene_type:complete
MGTAGTIKNANEKINSFTDPADLNKVFLILLNSKVKNNEKIENTIRTEYEILENDSCAGAFASFQESGKADVI